MAATPGLATRLKRAAAFVAIVWGVAASFVAFELAALRGMNLALAYPELFGGVLLSRAVSESTSCMAGTEAGGDRSLPGAPANSFALGVGVGREAVFRQWATATPEAIGPLTAAVHQAAGDLGVPFPGSFEPQQRANAHREYVAWIEADRHGTARQLAGRYSPRACHAYKLGAVWGYSEAVRMALPAERAALAVEIRHYARQIRLPERLWEPMLEPARSPAGSAELEAEMAVVSEQVLAFLREQPPPP